MTETRVEPSRTEAAGAPRSGEATADDYRRLMEEVDRVVEGIEAQDDQEHTVLHLAETLVRALGPTLGVTGGRLYLREEGDYRLWTTFGAAREGVPGTRVPVSYAPLRRCLDRGTLYARGDDPEADPALESELGAGERFAALEVGNGEYLLSFDVTVDHDQEQVNFTLGLVRNSINQRVRQEQIEDVFRQARRIQQSILPRQVPKLGDFELAARSVPVETVGGDFYDAIEISDKILGLAIADVSGHGLPAALQVRDVYMGLRMAAGRDFKIVRTVERLNQIIHLGTMTTRFVSMVYGELEEDGTFIYVNAGHPPPFRMKADGSVDWLTKGGTVLGPLAKASYTRGYLTMEAGDVLVFYTDGVTETRCFGGESGAGSPGASGAERPGAETGRERAGRPAGSAEAEEYGVERLVEVVRRNRGLSAGGILEAVFGDVEAFCGCVAAGDDRTVAVVRRGGR